MPNNNDNTIKHNISLDPIWESKNIGTPAHNVQTKVSSLIHGGQFGWGKGWGQIQNNTPYTSNNLITILLEAPLGFKLLPDSKNLIASLKSLVETIRHRVDGLSHKLDVQTSDNQAFGGSGQKIEVPINVTEEQLSVTFSFHERPGLAIKRFFEFWIRVFIKDPETKYAAITTLIKSSAYDPLLDMYSMTMLFIEPDNFHSKVVQSWIGVGMFPKSTGDNTAKFDKENPSETRELQIQFSGVYQYGPGVDLFSQKVLDSINIIGANVYNESALHGQASIDALVANADNGYNSTVKNISKNQFN